MYDLTPPVRQMTEEQTLRNCNFATALSFYKSGVRQSDMSRTVILALEKAIEQAKKDA
jgi:hypothetical protein